MGNGESASDQRYVIVGGGIAGVSCAEQLSHLVPDANVVVISGTPLIKAITNFRQISRSLEEFEVKEKTISYLTQMCPNVRVMNMACVGFHPKMHTVRLADSSYLHYSKLCICTGAVPKVIAKDHPRVLGIRDTESVEEFQKKLVDVRRIVVIGNGGIGTELVYEVSGCEVVWAIKDKSIGHTFFDEGAATFFLPHLSTAHHSAETGGGKAAIARPVKRSRYMLDAVAQEKPSPFPESSRGPRPIDTLFQRGGIQAPFLPPGCTPPPKPDNCEIGSALGPDWHSTVRMKGGGGEEFLRHVHVEYECEVANLLTPEELAVRGLKAAALPSQEERRFPQEDYWPVYVELTNGRVYGCDLVVSATGVVPNTAAFQHTPNMEGGDELKFAEDGGGIVVDSEMRTTLPDVYAAGDVCTVDWDPLPKLWFQVHLFPRLPKLWFQMRLWTQARQMGTYTAQCMVAHQSNESISRDFCFELFSHVTKFFGFKVVLLGRYNAQGLGDDYEVLLRCTKGMEYIKVILQNGRMVGAILIGETDLEETFENLILNQMDLSRFGESLLDPNIDIEDYFD